MNYKYYVVSWYYDNGKTKAEILTKDEAAEKNYSNGLFEEHDGYELYVNGFDSIEEAKQEVQDIKNA